MWNRQIERGHTFDGTSSSLPMNEISVHERVFEQRCHGVNVVLSHFADVFEQETRKISN
jgi:hypothetical protein